MDSALLLDSKLSSHPIEVDVPDAEQIDQVDSFSSRVGMEVLTAVDRSLTAYRMLRLRQF